MRTFTLVFLVLSSINLFVSSLAVAQHETAVDIQSGERSFAGNCANCHGPDGDLIPGIDLGRGLFRRPLSDADIVGIIMNGIPNTPMPATPRMTEEQAAQIVAYLRSTALERRNSAALGDPERGRLLFEGKGDCTDCHRVFDRGARTGPDLSNVGLLRKATELELSLLDPAAEVQAANRTFSVTTRSGETVTGRLLNHDTFTVQLFDSDERLRSFDKTNLTSYGFEESPMPSYRGKLDSAEIADLVSYLVSLRGFTEQ